MMNKLFGFLIVLSLAACSGTGSSSGSITLDIKDIPPQTVLLKLIDGKNQPLTLDSVRYEGKGTIVFKSTFKTPAYLQVVFGNNPAANNNFIPIISEGGKITVKGEFAKLKEVEITGSTASTEMMAFLKNINKEREKINAIGMALDTLKPGKKYDSTKLANQKNFDDLLLQSYNQKLDFARKTNNPVLAIIAFQTFNSLEELKNGKPLMDSLKTKFEKSEFFNNSYTAYLSVVAPKQKENEQLETSVSVMAKEISLPDVNGKTVTLSSFKGKYVLIDFWASWCGPCRAENPNVVAAYNKFKNKNFTVLGVSLDKDKDAWLAAIKQDGLAWTQISDLKYWQCQAARDYGIESIPANYLVDPTGKIIGSDLRGGVLEAKLASVLK